MKCLNCGNEIDQNDLFCPKCGAKIELQQNDEDHNFVVNSANEKKSEIKELEVKGGNTFIFNAFFSTSFKTTIIDDNGDICVNMVQEKILKDKPIIENFSFSRTNLAKVTTKNKIRKSPIFYIQLIASLCFIGSIALAIPGILILLLSIWVALHKVASIELTNGETIDIYIHGKKEYNQLVDFLLNSKD